VATYYKRFTTLARRLRYLTPGLTGPEGAVASQHFQDRVVSRFMFGLNHALRSSLVGRRPKDMKEARDFALEAEEVQPKAPNNEATTR
jgi:hypothetical protein